MSLPADVGSFMPGPEIDRLIEEFVFDHPTAQKWVHRRTKAIAERPGKGGDWFVERVICGASGNYSPVRKWSTDPQLTLHLLEHMRRLGLRVTISGDKTTFEESWKVLVEHPTSGVAWHGVDRLAEGETRLPSFELAACRAALAWGRDRHHGSKGGRPR